MPAKSRLTIRQPDTTCPTVFQGPYGTVSFEVDEDVLNVLVKPGAHPADWDVAEGLMRRILDPARWKVPSALASVDFWQIELA
jgi:hypothetical protein